MKNQEQKKSVHFIFRTKSIYYLEKKYLQDNIVSEIIGVKKDIKKLKNDSNDNIEKLKELEKILEGLNGNRPCVVVSRLGLNVTVAPITTRGKSEFNIEISPLQKYGYKSISYVKISNLITFSVDKFERINSKPRNNVRTHLTDDEFENILTSIKDTLGKDI